jgi:hypothetical protein
MLTVGDVRDIRVQRAQVNHETYKSIVLRLYERIKRRAAAGFTSLEFAVPPFVPGRPVFEHAHAVRYATEKLQRGGFGVKDTGGGMLEVDWAHDPSAPAARPKPTKPRDDASDESIRPKSTKPEELARRLDNLKRRLRWSA